MPLAADCIGLELASGIVPIDARGLLAYAAALGFDDEPRFMDDARPGGLEAVPFICTRFEWRLQRELRRHPALGLTPGETDRGVHFVQDSRFFKPLRPGMNVEARGRVSDVRPVRTGALVAYDYTIEDTDGRDLLCASRSISIFRDVAVTAGDEARQQGSRGGQARSQADPPAPSLDEGARVCLNIARGFPHIYTECAEIWNPVHTERTAALAAGLPDIILHGTATWALAGRELLAAYGRGRQIKRLAGRFTGNVIPPATLALRHRPDADEPATVHFDVTGADGAVVLAGGLAEFAEAA